ncbi:CHAD domain-containing protein [Streptomyces sp. NPDC052773]|uniref:CYTH and CHAD domain-containing protein n=1 Tax=Streptomyces sp. NPDC052773 TaxID=3365693 RepID=UPI0037CE5BB8
MADTKREIERKYASGDSGLPDLTGVAGVAAVLDKGVAELDAVYYDTADHRLAADSITLRRRTGGADAGWHLKFPVAPGVRDEIRAPLSDTLPDRLAGLVRSRVRDAELLPVVRLRSSRDVRDLVDAEGRLLAEVSVDAVRADRLTKDGRSAQWTEIEVELADGRDPAFLDKVEKRLRRAGVRPSDSPSKLARALAETAPKKTLGQSAPKRKLTETAPKPKRRTAPKKKRRAAAGTPAPVTAGDHLLVYLRRQRDAIVALDPAVRRDVPDSVHALRVATRRLRSAFRSYDRLLDPAATAPIGAGLRRLAAELGADRDREVLAERLTAALADLPRTLVIGPVRSRVRTWSHARRGGSRRRLIAVLDSRPYLDLLDALDALLADPPLRKAAAGRPEKELAKAVRKDFDRLAGRIEQALALPPGHDRDLALHEARKAAKRTRYAAEAAGPALGEAAVDLVRSMSSLQGLLGDHQDSVMTREALLRLAADAQAAGESAFTYGLLYGREERRAESAEAALVEAWAVIRRETALETASRAAPGPRYA